jgi:hypothetical protein
LLVGSNERFHHSAGIELKTPWSIFLEPYWASSSAHNRKCANVEALLHACHELGQYLALTTFRDSYHHLLIATPLRLKGKCR